MHYQTVHEQHPWHITKLTFEGVNDEYVTYYRYKSIYPHAGVGKRIQF